MKQVFFYLLFFCCTNLIAQPACDTTYISGYLYLQRNMSAELNFVAGHIDTGAQAHAHELWEEYLNRPHPSVATVNAYYQQAATEFDVPVELLQVIGQVENNWTQLGPSIDKGWGIMHLVQNNYCNTLGEAAQLLQLPEQVIKDDARQNIRAAAALLKQYKLQEGNTGLRVEDWYNAVKKYSGLISPALQTIQANRYYTTLKDGISALTLWGEQVVIPRHSNLDMAYLAANYATEPETEGGRSSDYGPAVSSYTTCNYSSSRNHSIDTWVNHWIGTGTAAGAVSWFQNCSAQASAHFVTATNGTIYQVVPVASTAWHCGASGYPYNNGRSIGEEHEATVANPQWWNSTAMLQASAQMACYFSNLYGIPTHQNNTSPGICGHQNMPGTNTNCPGNIPWSTWFGYFNSGNCTSQAPVQPANDYCGNATALTVYGSTCGTATTGDVGGATQSAAPAQCSGYASTNANDVWYTFTATATSHNITVVASAGLDAVVDLRTACPGTSIACRDAGGGEGGTEVLTATGLTIGNTYYVRVYDYTGAGNAPTTTSFTICVTTTCTAPIKPVISGTASFCSGQNSQLSITNPCTGCSFTWSNGATGNSTTVSTSGTYRVTATNNCGTTVSDPFTVTVNPTPQPVISNLSNAYCAAAANVTLTATPTGGAFAGPGISGNVFSPSAAGVGTHPITYTVTQGGCTGNATQQVTIAANPLVQITAGGPLAFCTGGSVTLTATQGSAYAWNNGGTTQSVTITQPGSYNVTVTNPGGCNAAVAADSAAVVVVYSNPLANAGAPQTLLQAPGNTVTLGGAPTAAGGTAPYTYLWSPPNSLNATNAANPVVSNLAAATTYYLTVTDANGCSATAQVSVSVVPFCTFTPQPGYFNFLPGGGTDSFYVTVSDTACAAWDVNSCAWLALQTPPLPASGSSWVVFTVQPNTDSLPRTCLLTLTGGQTVPVTQQGVVVNPCSPPLPVPGIQQNFCDLVADNISGVSYQWYLGGNIISGANSRFYTVTQPGYYYVAIADLNFCSAQSVDLYVPYPACLGTGAPLLQPVERNCRVWPNPSNNDVLNLKVPPLMVNSKAVLTDALGQVLTVFNVTEEQTLLAVPYLPAGMYHLHLLSSRGSSVALPVVRY